MVSAIDATKPEDGELPVKADFRENFGAAKSEIEALQDDVAASLSALAIASGQSTFPILGGDNTPSDPATLAAILLALDAAITAAANSGGGGGPSTLSDITDILTPSAAQRVAFQRPIDGGALDNDFNFDEGAHAGRWLVLNTTVNPVTMTLPPAASINRPDGRLCRVTATSSSNFAAVAGPADALRFQQNRFGADATQTTVFLGLSRSAGQRSLFDIYKDGSIYQIVGPGRITEADDLRIGAPGSVNGSVLATLSLLADAFPNLLDLGGIKQTGGGRGIVEPIAGNHAFLQANSGRTLEHTGGALATWDVPALLPGTVVEVDNAIGGTITLNNTGGLAPIGGTTLASGAAGAVKWLSGNRVRFIGTT